MRKIFIKPVVRSTLLGILLVGLLWFFDRSFGQKQTHMAHVGGTPNQCNCTDRIEK